MALVRGEVSVEIPSGPLTLEGALFSPKVAPKGLGLVCHPHPALGGTMDNKIAMHLARGFHGLDFITLRFNFRGVGASGGAHDEGRGEVGDVAAALQFLKAQWTRGTAPFIGVGGYSFGSFTGLKATFEDPDVHGFVAIAPPWELFDFSFLLGFQGPLVMMVGEEDPVCSPADARRLISELQLRAEVMERPEVDHLFHGSGPWIRQGLQDFFVGIDPTLRPT